MTSSQPGQIYFTGTDVYKYNCTLLKMGCKNSTAGVNEALSISATSIPRCNVTLGVLVQHLHSLL